MAHEQQLFDKFMQPLTNLRRGLYKSIKAASAALPADRATRMGDFSYWLRTERGLRHPVLYRSSSPLEASALPYFDPNLVLGQDEGVAVISLRIGTTGHRVAAVVRTTTGDKALITYDHLARKSSLLLGRACSMAEWGADDRLLYVLLEENQRPSKLIEIDPAQPDKFRILLEENRPGRYLEISRSKDTSKIFLRSFSLQAAELYALDLKAAEPSVQLLASSGNVVAAEYFEGRYYLLDNRSGSLRVLDAECGAACPSASRELVRADDPITDFDLFQKFILLFKLKAGQPYLAVIDHGGKELARFLAEGPPLNLKKIAYQELELTQARFSGSSPALLPKVFTYDHAVRKLVGGQAAGAIDSNLKFEGIRLLARSSDGTSVPVSLFRAGGQGQIPILLSVYAAYGALPDLAFSPLRRALLDHGVGIAVCHARGGGDFGSDWHDAGRLTKKLNSVMDLEACAEELIRSGATAANLLFVYGRSAGSLTAAAALNRNPALWRGALLEAPFLDLLSSSLNSALPHTQREFLEWGDPGKLEELQYLRSYSPMQNVAAHDYPAILISLPTADELIPANHTLDWAEVVRSMRTDDDPLLIHPLEGATHSMFASPHQEVEANGAQAAFILGILDDLRH